MLQGFPNEWSARMTRHEREERNRDERDEARTEKLCWNGWEARRLTLHMVHSPTLRLKEQYRRERRVETKCSRKGKFSSSFFSHPTPRESVKRQLSQALESRCCPPYDSERLVTLLNLSSSFLQLDQSLQPVQQNRRPQGRG